MSNPARFASSVRPVFRSIAAPLPVAKCKATTSGTRRPRFASGTRRIVSSGAPATVVAGVADGQPAVVGWASRRRPAWPTIRSPRARPRRRPGQLATGGEGEASSWYTRRDLKVRTHRARGSERFYTERTLDTEAAGLVLSELPNQFVGKPDRRMGMSASGGDPAGGGGTQRRRYKDERERREKKDGISRRDFLDGVAVSAAGLAAASALPGLTGAEAARARGRRAAAAGLLPADVHGPSPASRTTSSSSSSRSTASRPRRDVHSTGGGTGLKANRVQDTGEVYDCVDRRRRRERPRGGEVLPRPLRARHEDPRSSTRCPTSAATRTATSSTSRTRPTAAPT